MAESEKAGGEAEAEYESDLDDAPLPAARRRAAASEDEEDGDEGGGGSGSDSPPPSSTVFDSESDRDGQGAAELYDYYDDGGEGVYSTDEEERGAEGVGREGGGEVELVTGEVVVAPEDEGKYEEEESAVEGEEEEAAVEGEEEETAMKGEEVKMGSEPDALPMAGAFYQHDSRFQGQEDGGRGHQRQFFGGQKIWNPKDEGVWVHDRFDEINFHDNTRSENHDNVSMMQSIDNGYFDGTRSYSGTKSFDKVQTQSYSYHGNVKGYNDERNVYREKGSRTYQSHWTTSKSYSRSQNAEVSSNAGVRKHSSQTLSMQHEQTLPCNQTFGSNTSSGPTPFYSSRSFHQEFPFQREKARRVTFNKLFSSAVHKAGLQPEQTLPCKQTFLQRETARRVTFNKLFSSAVHKAHNSLTPQSRPIFRRKAFAPCASFEQGTAVDSHHSIVPIDAMSCSALHSMSTSHNYSKDSEFWDQNTDLNIAETTRACTEPQIAVYKQRQPPILSTPRASAQIFVQKDTGTNKIQSHPQITLIRSSDDSKATTPSETNSSVVLSAVTVQDDVMKAERTSFLDGGSLVGGDTEARGSTIYEQCSTSTPTKLPVMLFGGLHPMGPGFPSVSMVMPGFLGQQCDGNSEMGLMTWFPILTGASGVQEGTSSPPNFGSYCPELPSSLPSRDHGATNDPTSLTSQEIPEAVSHELVHRRNRTRRYSEMSFAL
ncbi:unnamed protein product [Urochloa decumbens]|uniref:Btz domain-containing protein n=1 Tax=Urochloa decumbens TaxID=240449 RepID=A0ABC8ZK63_9POAL